MTANRTKIEWCDYVINPVKGICPMHCKDNFGKEYCYSARPNGLYKRFKWNPEIRFEADVLWDFEVEKPSRVFIGSTIELFGDWIPNEYLEAIFQWIGFAENQRHTFIFLTKLPQNLPKEWPPNCWVGITVTRGLKSEWLDFAQVRAGKTFVSFEPLLAPVTDNIHLIRNLGIDWLIIGQQTPVRKATMPNVEWVSEIVQAADRAGVKVFLKNNLEPLIDANCPAESNLIPNHNRLFRMKHPALCLDCDGEQCHACGVIWKLRQEFPVGG